MKREFTVERQGRSFVLYAGLLDEAHQQGLKVIRTHLVQIPTLDNGNVAIAFAEVQTEKGCFTGVGDASPDNVARVMVPHLIRMAETRAKARALRDSINIGAVAVEELADIDEMGIGSPPSGEPPRAPAERAPAEIEPRKTPIDLGLFAANANRPRPAPAEAKVSPVIDRGGMATPAQVRAIYLIGRNQHGLSEAVVDERAVATYGSAPAELTKRQASDFITALKGESVAAEAR